MKVLLIKMSSLGDIVHTFPALVEARANISNLEFDWVVEENFVDLVSIHPNVSRIIPVALRRWRKNLWQAYKNKELGNSIKQLKNKRYDLIIDAQGLIKSAVLGKLAHGKLVGFNKYCVRESIASYFYAQKYNVDMNYHIVERNRDLMAQSLNYVKSTKEADFGLSEYISNNPHNYIMLFHGTTWASKHYPVYHWRKVLEFCDLNKIKVKLPWGNKSEYDRATTLAHNLTNVEVLPKLSLLKLIPIVAQSRLCITLDTGLGHLASALKVPCIGLYGPTDPKLIGTYGANQIHLCTKSPLFGKRNKQQICLDKLDPQDVICALAQTLGFNNH